MSDFIRSGTGTTGHLIVDQLRAGQYTRLTDGTTTIDTAQTAGTANTATGTLIATGWTVSVYDGNPASGGVLADSFSPVFDGETWDWAKFYPCDFPYTVDVAITNNVATAIDGYAVQLALTSANFDFTRAKSDGSDLRVVDDQNLLIPFYISAWNQGAKTGTVWVKPDHIAGSGSVTIRLRAGNPTPHAFVLPPTGEFTRATSLFSGLAENMVYDAATNAYYIVTSAGTAGPIDLYTSSAPGSGWSRVGTIVAVGSAGQWDHSSLMAPHLLQLAGIWYCFYSGGLNASQDGQIGYASCATVNGTYVKYAGNPVLSPSANAAYFDRYRAVEPFLFQYNGNWMMFYMGDTGTAALPSEQVGFATPASAFTGAWTAQQTTTPKLAFGPTLSIDAACIADPWVYGPVQGRYYVGYAAEPYHASSGPDFIQTCHAVTKDFVNFYKGGPVYGPSGISANFDQYGSFRGAVSRFANSYYLPITLGNSGGTFVWGISSMGVASTATGYDPWCVFGLYDYFAGSSLDANKWSTQVYGGSNGAATVSGGVMSLTSGTVNSGHMTLCGNRGFGVGYMCEAAIEPSAAPGTTALEVAAGFAFTGTRNPRACLAVYNSAYVQEFTVLAAGTSHVAQSSVAPSTVAYQLWQVWLQAAANTEFQVAGAGWDSTATDNPDSWLQPFLWAYRSTASVTLNCTHYIARPYVATEPTAAYKFNPVILRPGRMRY